MKIFLIHLALTNIWNCTWKERHFLTEFSNQELRNNLISVKRSTQEKQTSTTEHKDTWGGEHKRAPRAGSPGERVGCARRNREKISLCPTGTEMQGTGLAQEELSSSKPWETAGPVRRSDEARSVFLRDCLKRQNYYLFTIFQKKKKWTQDWWSSPKLMAKRTNTSEWSNVTGEKGVVCNANKNEQTPSKEFNKMCAKYVWRNCKIGNRNKPCQLSSWFLYSISSNHYLQRNLRNWFYCERVKV